MKKEVAKQCEKLERDIKEVESLVKKNKELESKNREILERDCELNKQLSELQERLVVKEKVCFYLTKSYHTFRTIQSKFQDHTCSIGKREVYARSVLRLSWSFSG